MIKLTSFYPFSNFLRVTQEFHEDKVVVREKSLTYEREFEFNYVEIGEISDAYYASFYQNKFSFWLLCSIAIALTVFHNLIHTNLVLLRTIQILYASALLLYGVSYIKSWYITFSDKNGKFLTQIKQTRQNQDLISKAIETIKSKSKDVQEISITDPFPEVKPSFEHIDYKYLNTTKTIERFYKNEIVGFKKTLWGDNVYSIKYSRLSGKVYREKAGNDVWGITLTMLTLIASIMIGLILGFDVHPSKFIYYTFIGLAILVAISFMLIFVKHETVGLYDVNGNVIYSIRKNRSNKEKIEEIIKFVQSKTPSEKKD